MRFPRRCPVERQYPAPLDNARSIRTATESTAVARESLGPSSLLVGGIRRIQTSRRSCLWSHAMCSGLTRHMRTRPLVFSGPKKPSAENLLFFPVISARFCNEKPVTSGQNLAEDNLWLRSRGRELELFGHAFRVSGAVLCNDNPQTTDDAALKLGSQFEGR